MKFLKCTTENNVYFINTSLVVLIKKEGKEGVDGLYEIEFISQPSNTIKIEGIKKIENSINCFDCQD